MNCPVCKAELKRIVYEGMSVFRCFGCAGYLMQEKRLDSIRRIPRNSLQQLKQEVINESQLDTIQKMKCPRCFHPMDKVKLKGPAALTIDVCSDCDHVWLDGGELARIQMAYEISDLGRGNIELRRRYESLTPEEKEELQRRIDRLPASSASSLFGDDLFAIFLLRGCMPRS